MLLNHKDALDFILDNPDYLSELTVAKIETIHSILVKELAVDRNIRIRRVGITGTNYRPLDNEFQIREALEQMCQVVNRKENVFEKALLILLLISYIQPFDDGNKRTARIVSNALLIANNYCPLSFRTVDSIDYKKAMLLFYEQNNLSAFKQIFIEQFAFAVKPIFETSLFIGNSNPLSLWVGVCIFCLLRISAYGVYVKREIGVTQFSRGI